MEQQSIGEEKASKEELFLELIACTVGFGFFFTSCKINSYFTTIRPLSDLTGKFKNLFHIVKSVQGSGAKNRGDEDFSLSKYRIIVSGYFN